MTTPIIALTTDFGTRDYYVAAVKGVILGIIPDAVIVDVTHEIDPHNVQQGAFVLRQVWPWYPEGTIHIAVVDPGVGSERRILLGRYAGRWVIAPDNGMVTFLHREIPVETMHVVENRKYFAPTLSSTFHARDIMAPVAAHLARGVPPHEFGRATDRIELLPIESQATITQERAVGMVLYVDHFGTLVTNIRRDQVDPAAGDVRGHVVVNGQTLGAVRTTFSDVAPGEPVALWGGCDRLEIAVHRGRAVDRYGDDARVILEW